MKTAGIAIDDWKLPIFKKHLDKAGYKYTEHPGVNRGTLLLRVQCDWASELMPVVKAADKECAEAK